MTSGFKKIIIIVSVIFAIILSLLASVIFFPKKRNALNQNNQQEENQLNNPDNKPEELTEEEKVKNMAESFAMTYYSYAWGNFSNIESQYYHMADEMKNREEVRVAEMKKEIENQPRKYFTARAKLINSNLVYREKERAAININLSIDNFAGAIVQRDTMVWVDERGDRYAGDIKNLIMNTAYKNIEINLIKIGGEWKVSEIKEK